MTQSQHNPGINPAATRVTFGLWANPVTALSLIALWITLAIVFNGEPQFDQAVSAYFFTTKPCAANAAAGICGAFGISRDWGLSQIRQFFHVLPVVVAIVVVAMLVRDLMAGLKWQNVRVRFEAVALAALAVGPGIIVNVILKDHWGRPRPYSTDLFGGRLPFVPAGQISTYCHSNCSFVSGEASGIFWLLCLVPLLPPALRLRMSLVLAAIAIFTSGLRVAFGGHYLSDVVLGGLLTLIVFACLAVLSEYLTARRLAPKAS